MLVRILNEVLADPNMQERDLTVEFTRTRHPGGNHGGRRPGAPGQPPLWFRQFQITLDNRLNQMEANLNARIDRLETRLDRIVELNHLKQ